MFAPYKRGAESDALEYLPVTAAEAVVVGEALIVTSGKLTKCGATAAPTYLAAGACTAAEATAGKRIPVIRVSKDVIYQTELTAAYAGIAAGAKVTISSNGLGITATTTSGVAEIVDWDGTAVGSPVRVRF